MATSQYRAMPLSPGRQCAESMNPQGGADATHIQAFDIGGNDGGSSERGSRRYAPAHRPARPRACFDCCPPAEMTRAVVGLRDTAAAVSYIPATSATTLS